jgi:hypothetical protein
MNAKYIFKYFHSPPIEMLYTSYTIIIPVGNSPIGGRYAEGYPACTKKIFREKLCEPNHRTSTISYGGVVQ